MCFQKDIVFLDFELYKHKITQNSLYDLFLLLKKIIYLFLAVLGLRCCVWAFSSCGERGLLCCGARASHTVASLVVEHGL